MKLVTLAIALFLNSSANAADLVLVNKDTPPAPIVVFKDAPLRTREAAVTLADCIQKISGARPGVIEGEPHPLPERAIWVGVQPVVKTLFPNIDFNYGTINAVYTFLQDQPACAGSGRVNLAKMQSSATVSPSHLSSIGTFRGFVPAVASFIFPPWRTTWI